MMSLEQGNGIDIKIQDKSERSSGDSNKKTKNTTIELKDELKQIQTMNNYLKMNQKWENVELDCLDSGSESVVHHFSIFNQKRREKKKNAILKVILPDKINEKEIKISSKLKHNNIISYYGHEQLKENKLLLLLLEEAKYKNLRTFQKDYLKRKYMSESFINYVAYQILKGLEYLHKCGIAHMDLKPQNLVVDEYFNIKIIDFSISLNYKNIQKEKIKLDLAGTNFYMSREVLRRDTINVKDLNKVDLYAFGVILYNMGFGCYPYGLKAGMEKKYDEILKNIEGGKLEFDEEMNFSPLFLDFLDKLLKKNIEERMNLHEALNHPWIKGVNLLLEEKEKIGNTGIFLTYLITDHCKSFND